MPKKPYEVKFGDLLSQLLDSEDEARALMQEKLQLPAVKKLGSVELHGPHFILDRLIWDLTEERWRKQDVSSEAMAVLKARFG